MYTYCANNPIYYSDPTGHIAVVDDIVIATAILVAGVVTTALSQPEVQEGLSTMINKASYAVEEFAENAASVIASAAISVASAVSEVTGISSAPVLAPPTGIKKKFSTLVDSNYNPYLEQWFYASMGSQSIAKDDADSIEKNIDIPYLPIKKSAYFPENPNDFQPIGLVPGYGGTKNGKIIFWNSPITNHTVFTWHENSNYNNGSHYYINDIDKGSPNKEHTHFYPGELVPEPYASIYFGGK